MNISLESRLMPQYLPGSPARARWTQLEMTPTADGQALLWSLDADGQLTLWLPSEDSTTPWRRLNPTLEGREAPRVWHMALSHTAGLDADGRVDIALVADVGDGVTPQPRWFVWNAVSTTTDPATWRQRFEQAQSQDTGGLIPEQSHWGQLPREYRSRLLQGRFPDGRRALWWQRFDHMGQPLDQALDELPATTPADAVLTAACAVTTDAEGRVREGYARNVVSENTRHGYMTMVWPATGDVLRHEVPVQDLRGTLDGWEPCEGLWSVTPQGGSTWVYFDTNRDTAGAIDARFLDPVARKTTASVPGAVIPGRVHALYRSIEPAKLIRLELCVVAQDQPNLLRLTESATPTGEGGRSTYLEAGVDAFTVCECVQAYQQEAVPPLTVLHVLVGFEEGGLWLLSKDNRSGLWQRRLIIDDDVATGLSQVTSQTTRVQVSDDSSAPLTSASVRLRVQTPCHAYVDGRSVHLSPVAETVIEPGPTGAFTLIQPTRGLGVPLIDMAVVASGQPTRMVSLNPMQRMVDRMRPVTTGQALQDQVGSDGRKPFAHLPLAQCDLAVARLQPMLRAYDGTLPRPTGRPAATRVVERVALRRGGAWVTPEVSAIDRAPTPLDDFDDLGDMLACLWSADDATGDLTLDFLDNGVAELLVTIGDLAWTALIELPDQAADLIDWALQNSLGVSLKDLINWLGQVFDWEAILRTQKVLKHYLQLNQRFVVDWLRNDAPGDVACATAQAKAWLAGLPDLSPTARELVRRPARSGDQGLAQDPPPAAGPDALWMQTQLGQFGPMADFGTTTPPDIGVFFRAVENAGRAFEQDAERLQTWITGVDLQTVSPLQTAEEALALVGATAFDTAEAFVLTLLPGLADQLQELLSLADTPVDIPVLSALYTDIINPGAQLSALEALMLGAAIAGHVGSELVAGQPMISEEVAARILAAQRWEDLIVDLEAGGKATNSLSTYNAISSLTSGLCKLVYFALWSAQSWGEVRTPATVRWRTIADSFSWLIAFSWAVVMLTQAKRLNRDEQAYTLNVVLLLISGIANRGKDAVDIYYSNDDGTPAAWRKWLAALEAIFGGFVLCVIAAWQTGVSVDRLKPPPDTDETAWNSLLALSNAAGLSTGVYYALALEEFTEGELKLALRVVRTAANSMRSIGPLASSFVLFRCASQGWSAPGLTSD